MKFKVAELFGGYGHSGATIQGEARYLGTPSVFLRVFGCSMECRGFGMPLNEDGFPQRSTEPEQILELVKSNPDKYKTLMDIPLAKTGCDSFISWHKGFKSFAKDYTIDELVEEIKKLVPKGFYKNKAHLVITGGEPLLPGQQKKYPALLERLWEECGLYRITFETNGTEEITPEFMEWIKSKTIYSHSFQFSFSCSVKLNCSGEPYSKRINQRAINSYCNLLYHNKQSFDELWFKFVAGSDKDFDEIDGLMSNEFEQFKNQVYIMPIGGTADELKKYEPFVINECLNRGYSFSPRYHVTAFANEWGK